ncbi:MAG TPA: acetyl-CoA hydrolase/transferase C-terminal domain-containing protein [Syntrophomonadaceae bacterium]|jgi:4-hydroxybutyrate CoA-transferase|nr:acetyl-CoA hydrolase/transferase C-terminal domain-containing protein [Syntrophomonadaceae bacterium]HRX21635.1 acetyl-CoA hydrolase/transferase C-terminal domain-containing protein [Syntrophomonadaceae bacterium]
MNRWQEMYKQKLMNPDDVIENFIVDGDKVISPLGNGLPPGLISALAKKIKADELKDILYIDALNVRCFDIIAPDIQSKLIGGTSYVTPLNRWAINSGITDFVPMRFSDSSRLIVEEDVSLYGRQTEYHKINVSMHCVSPMDEHGFFSTGTDPDHSYAVATQKYPHKLFVEVNEHMPRTYGNNHVHISQVDAVVENHVPLFALPEIPISQEDEAIGRYIAEYIPDGSCIQLGIGGIPNAVAKFLGDKKDLSVHSEMLCDSYRDLYYQGVITSRGKTYMPDKWVATFVFGSQKLYDFIDENPLIYMCGTELVNHPRVACLNDKLMSINTTVEVDLSGQCASESMAYRQYTGIGGQLDFVRASAMSNGGKAFICTYSTYTDKEGKLQSKIVPTLKNIVSVGRADVQYIVTEYGIANLKNSPLQERIKKLINLAHPDFRDWLKFEARKLPV